MTFKYVGGVAAFALLVSGSAWAADLNYTPMNPSFGGNPLNSSHLLGLANAQRTATASDAKSSSSSGGTGTGTGGGTGTSDADLFVQQLQGRLLSALASQVTDAIFGDNPQENGTVQFGDTTVEFIRSIDSITLIITDPTGVTQIVVPQLVTNTNNTFAARAMSEPTGDISGQNTLMQQSLSSGLSESHGDLTTGSLSAN